MKWVFETIKVQRLPWLLFTHICKEMRNQYFKMLRFSQMLLNLHKKSWIDGLMLEDYNSHCKTNETTVKEMLELAKNYNKVCER